MHRNIAADQYNTLILKFETCTGWYVVRSGRKINLQVASGLLGILVQINKALN